MKTQSKSAKTELKSFNREIQVVIQVDSISEKLFNMMKEDEPHAALVVNTLIGQMLENERMGDLSRLFNAVSGFEIGINFEEGQVVYCTKNTYNGVDGITGKAEFREIGECKIIKLSKLRDSGQVLIQYTDCKSQSESEKVEIWVNTSDLKLTHE